MQVTLSKDAVNTGNFEIFWGDKLVHSKVTRDQGFPTLDQLTAIAADIRKAIPSSLESTSAQPEAAAVKQLTLTPQQLKTLGCTASQAEALAKRGYARPEGLIRHAAAYGLSISQKDASALFK